MWPSHLVWRLTSAKLIILKQQSPIHTVSFLHNSFNAFLLLSQWSLSLCKSTFISIVSKCNYGLNFIFILWSHPSHFTIKITTSSLLISEMQFHFLQVRPVFLVPKCIPFHLTVLKRAWMCLSQRNNLTFLVTAPATSANFTWFASVPAFFQIDAKVFSRHILL